MGWTTKYLWFAGLPKQKLQYIPHRFPTELDFKSTKQIWTAALLRALKIWSAVPAICRTCSTDLWFKIYSRSTQNFAPKRTLFVKFITGSQYHDCLWRSADFTASSLSVSGSKTQNTVSSQHPKKSPQTARLLFFGSRRTYHLRNMVIWLVVSNLLKILVNWDDYSQYMGK